MAAKVNSNAMALLWLATKVIATLYMNFKVNIFKVDLSVFTPACLPGTGSSFVGRTAVAYGI